MKTVTIIYYDKNFYLKNLGIALSKSQLPLYVAGREAFEGNAKTLTHDIFHHLKAENIGTLHDELMAVGGSYFINDQRNTSIEDVVCNDIIGLFDFYSDNLNEEKIKSKKRKNIALLQEITGIACSAKKQIMKYSSGYTKESLKMLEKFSELAVMLIYDGYMKNVKRYKYSPIKALDNCIAVESMLEKVLCLEEYFRHNDEIKISYGNARCYVGKPFKKLI